MKLSQLAGLLEYEDMRSVVKWCSENKILIVYSGKAKYVSSNQINQFFEKQFKDFTQKNYSNSFQIIEANNFDNKVGLSENMGIKLEPTVKKKYKEKTQRSKASQQLLNNLKSA